MSKLGTKVLEIIEGTGKSVEDISSKELTTNNVYYS